MDVDGILKKYELVVEQALIERAAATRSPACDRIDFEEYLWGKRKGDRLITRHVANCLWCVFELDDLLAMGQAQARKSTVRMEAFLKALKK